MQGADIFQQHLPLWNANQKSLLLKYTALSASINRPSYIITTAIIKKHLQNTHLRAMLCGWAQSVQVLEVLTSEGVVANLPLQGSQAAYLAQTAPRGVGLQQSISGAWVIAPRGLISCSTEQISEQQCVSDKTHH